MFGYLLGKQQTISPLSFLTKKAPKIFYRQLAGKFLILKKKWIFIFFSASEKNITELKFTSA